MTVAEVDIARIPPESARAAARTTKDIGPAPEAAPLFQRWGGKYNRHKNGPRSRDGEATGKMARHAEQDKANWCRWRSRLVASRFGSIAHTFTTSKHPLQPDIPTPRMVAPTGRPPTPPTPPVLDGEDGRSSPPPAVGARLVGSPIRPQPAAARAAAQAAAEVADAFGSLLTDLQVGQCTVDELPVLQGPCEGSWGSPVGAA